MNSSSMEKGETSALSVTDKASPNMEEDMSRSTALNSQSFPSSNVMGHHHRPSLSSTKGCDDDNGGGGGPTQNDSGTTEVQHRCSSPSPRTRTTSNIFPDHVASAVPNPHTITSSTSGGSPAATAIVVSTLQPFHISSPQTHTAFNSPGGGGGMAAALGFPFTASQWKELERQAMIYKYMMASMPVPPDLLLPFSTGSSSADPTAPCLSKGTLYNLRYGNRDPEPGRCKRTDGKKWRCSRDVAPHQKYCERHMHRGRPRSRKPVEVHPSVEAICNKKTRLHQSPLQTNPTTAPPNNSTFSPLFVGTTSQSKDPLILNGATGQNISKSSYREPNRVPGSMMDGEIVGTNVVGPQWLHMMDAKRGLAAEEDSIYGTNAASIMQEGYPQEPLNLFSYTDFGPENIHSRNNESHLLLNSDLISLKQPQLSEYPISRGFIDAFSNGDLNTVHNESSVSSSQGNLSPSSLNLSIAMAAGNALDEEMGLSEVTHSVADSDHRHKAKDGPVSWLPFGSGGPLAEVLQPSGIASGSNPTSPYITTANGESISPSATAVSSPSGVLHRAMLSHSDSSVCNSPTTIAASSAPPELVAFQWLT